MNILIKDNKSALNIFDKLMLNSTLLSLKGVMNHTRIKKKPTLGKYYL